eukprot:TRINITY_DN129_c0_g2_i1.p1 TRINITY_DN129_c0_g2~~TRINITY_DN129_c0_g2_i1.p1  ORF type:complete len:411 (+),score=76.18 TRINITY_DN129_c0_g2_i1:2-1234(+)
MKLALISTIGIICLCQTILALNNGLALKPQMGWNSWNHFACNVNETVVRAAADQLIETGLADLGFRYVNVDDCWAWKRDPDNDYMIIADPTSFPSGMKALAAYVHSKGLLFGVYSDAGPHTCGGRPGSLGFETIDAKAYASWGVDYLKYDNCNVTLAQKPEERYPVMRDALNATGRPILFSMCEWGVDAPWDWAPKVGNSWRTDNDIGDSWDSLIRVLDNQIGLSPFAGPGGWNDPDMLEVGNGGLTYQEERSHFALWCLLKSPLLLGNDLTQMSDNTKAVLGAKEVLAVSQDDLGVQGDLIWQQGPLQVWAGPLADGSRAIVMFNRHTPYNDYNATITVSFKMLGFDDSTNAVVRDLYARTDIGTFNGTFSFSVAPHDCFAGKITPTKMKPSYVNWRPISGVTYRADII